MTRFQLSWQALAALALTLVSYVMSVMTTAQADAIANPTATIDHPMFAGLHLVLFVAALVSMASVPQWAAALVLFVGAHVAAWILLSGISGFEGTALAPFFLALIAAWLLAWRLETVLSHMKPASRALKVALQLIIPLIFGVWLLILWEGITRGAGVSPIVLPPPSAIWAGMSGMVETLVADVKQTILKSALTGFMLGSSLGFIIAILADRFDFMRRGLLPIGNVFSALPIIGIAPIMVSWFGPDWPSKAAVVVVMTVFPMLVNTVAGLKSAGHMERDLMRTYASSYWQTLFKLRLPAAMPFIFNALKINATLAMIGAIIAEFFTTPTVGLGFRISTEIGLLRVNNAWAEIAVAALISSVFYGLIVLIERAVTFWHPSMRRRDA